MDIQNFPLSKNFSYYELTFTKNSDLLAFNRQAGLAYKDVMAGLCREILQPIRDVWGKPVMITSGYRCPQLNEKIGGSPNSQHMFGQAADLKIKDMNCGFVFDNLLTALPSLRFGQLIWEKNNGKEWIHISLPLRSVNNEVLTIFDGLSTKFQ